jgi:hypothetical protein
LLERYFWSGLLIRRRTGIVFRRVEGEGTTLLHPVVATQLHENAYPPQLLIGIWTCTALHSPAEAGTLHNRRQKEALLPARNIRGAIPLTAEKKEAPLACGGQGTVCLTRHNA